MKHIRLIAKRKLPQMAEDKGRDGKKPPINATMTM
jgi:hypothetical protein